VLQRIGAPVLLANIWRQLRVLSRWVPSGWVWNVLPLSTMNGVAVSARGSGGSARGGPVVAVVTSAVGVPH